MMFFLEIEVDRLDDIKSKIVKAADSSSPVFLVNLQHTTAGDFIDGVRAADTLIADYDGTLHAGNHWDDMRDCMTPELRAQNRAELDVYFSPARRSDRGDARFVFNTIESLCICGLTIEQVRQAALRRQPREGAVSFAGSFGRRAAIVSLGLCDYIRPWCDARGLSAEIFALRLMWDHQEPNRLVGCQRHSMVTDGNKGYLKEVFCADTRADPARTVVIGDAPTDLNMLSPENIGILLMPKRDTDPKRMESRLDALEKLWPRVSAILISDSLQPLAKMRG